MHIAVGQEWDAGLPERTPPEHWERALWEIAPPSEHVSWLKLAWHAEIERWAIYQMSPPMRSDPRLWAEDQRVVMGPHGRWMPDPNYRLLLNRGMMSRVGWRLYKETGHSPSLWWIIQGEDGGHRYTLDALEKKLASEMGAPNDTPRPGDLPYAPFDNRVVQAVGPLDKLRAYRGLVAFMDRAPELLDQEKKDHAIEARKKLWAWLRTQVQGRISEDRYAWRELFRQGVPTVDRETARARRPDYEKAEEAFITQPDSASVPA